MKSTIRVTLNESASSELLALMKLLDTQSPTHAANQIITEFYKSRLSAIEEINHVQRITSSHQ
jgi:hypothetical protein